MQRAARTEGIALHHQLSTLIRDAIAGGRYPAGAQLPTEGELVRQHGISRVTVRRALGSLQQQGLITRSAGRGTFVADSAAALQLPTPLSTYLAQVAQRRQLSRHVVKEFGWAGAAAEVASCLRVPAGAPVLRVVRLRVKGRLPLVHGTLYLPEAIGCRLARADFRRQPLSRLLEETGERYARIEMVTRARLATPPVARLLGVAVGSALVDVQRIGYNADGQPIEYQQLLGPPDRFETHVSIEGGAVSNAHD
jgi:GntR family transcriptional regulator